MKIRRFNPDGIQPTEVIGVREAENNLPEKWFGFANLLMRMPDPTKQAREIDLFIVSEDRIFLVDFKHWRGKVESRGGVWYQNNQRRGTSAATKIVENAKKLQTLIERDVPALGGVSPYVEACVVFTEETVDLSELSPSDKPHVWMLGDFIRTLRSKDLYRKRFGGSGTWNELRPLYEPARRKAIESFFCDKEHFEPREVVFSGYKPGPEPIYVHPRKIYSEYFCELLENPDYTALLRYWDFEAVSPEMSVLPQRRAIAERERAVLGFLNRVDPELYDEGVLRPDYWDDQFSLKYWDLFQIRRSMRRIGDYLRRRAPDQSRRLDLVSLLLGRVAALHRRDVAHRDIAQHSVWFDEQRSRVMLSAFMSAFFSERNTIGALRHKLTVAARVPEELDGEQQRGDPFRRDVFLIGVLAWGIVTDREIERTEDNVPIWFSEEFEATSAPAALKPWFEQALSMDPAQRFSNAIEMHDAFTAAVRRPDDKVSVEQCLAPYRKVEAPYLSYPPTRKIQTGRSNIWLSDVDGTQALVKLWPADPSRGNGSDYQRSVFMDSVRNLALRQVSWLPRILDYGLYQSDPFLVQEYVDAPTWRELFDEPIDADEAYNASAALLKAVEDMHTQSVAHGDLKPDNVLLKIHESGYQPLFIDLPDFAANDGELYTPEYAPTTGNADAFVRDRFATCKMISDLLSTAGVSTDEDDEYGQLLQAIERCGEGDLPWSSLAPLSAVVERIATRANIPSVTLRVGVPNTRGAERLLSVDGLFRVVFDTNEHTIVVVGMDEQLRIRIDATTKAALACWVQVSPGSEGWAYQNAALTFEGHIALYHSPNVHQEEVRWILDTPEIRSALDNMIAPASALPEAAPERQIQTVDAARPIDIGELWRATIEVEEDALTPIHVTGNVRFDVARRIHLIPCDVDLSASEFDVDTPVHVIWRDRSIGFVDVSVMEPGFLPVRDISSRVFVGVGDTLFLQSMQDRDNLSRRRRAIDRILNGEAEIPALLEYLDPRANVEPVEMASAIPNAADLDRYELNADQTIAFQQLWKFGPVGLLQGPPGTGKTRFIAAFVHFALTVGGLRNALVLSQSHEAVNNAVERLFGMFAPEEARERTLRVGQASRVSDGLIPVHSASIQDHYRELFASELKSRLRTLAPDLSLSEEYVTEAYELEERLSALSFALGGTEDEDDADGVHPAAQAAYHQLLEQYDLPADIEIMESRRQMHRALAASHAVSNPDATARLLRLMELSRDWKSALVGKRRTLEEFLTRSRSIVAGTCVGVGRRSLGVDRVPFDLVIIDEAAKCTPGELAVGVQSGRRVILVGDHKQLPPFYETEHVRALRERMDPSLWRDIVTTDFERALTSDYGRKVGHRLTKQYRMAPAISKLVSSCFYTEENLEADRGAPPQFYESLCAPLDREVTWIDTTPMSSMAYESKEGVSYTNDAEAKCIIKLLRMIGGSATFWETYHLQDRPMMPAIGVICMYAAQKELLNQLLITSGFPQEFISHVKIDTVDSYQGKENPIVIVSLVRNNYAGRASQHVQDLRRINVALSRAMERLVVVGAVGFFDRIGLAELPVASVIRYLRGPGQHEARIVPAPELLAVRELANA